MSLDPNLKQARHGLGLAYLHVALREARKNPELLRALNGIADSRFWCWACYYYVLAVENQMSLGG